MKQKLFFGAMAAMLLTACSQDDIIRVNEDEINFAVTAGSMTRAADSYCNNVLPESFKVWAQNVDDNSTYFSGDVVVNNGGNPATWSNTGGERYWPTNALNFFAEVNGDNEFRWNDGKPTFENFRVADDVREQVDLMYAVKLNQTKGGKVNLNFRHALSQVAFKAKNTNEKIYVEVSGVSVGHIGTQGTFTYAIANTDENWEDTDHNDIPHDVVLPGQGSWTDAQQSALTRYDVEFPAVALTSNITNLTAPEENHKNGFANVLTLLPQTVQAWNPEVKGTDYNGAYFYVKCTIWNKAGSEVNKDTDKVLYDGYAAIPASINWEQGKRYIYTFNFSNGTGGYEPDPENPRPVLSGIEYDLTVDDFVPVGGDIDMDGGKDQGNDDEKYDFKVSYYQDAETLLGSYSFNSTAPFNFSIAMDDPTREGYKFLGWATTPDGTAQYNYGSKISLGAEQTDFRLYAVWEKEVKYVTFRLIFDGNNPSTSGLSVTNIPAALEKTVEEGTASVDFIIPDEIPVVGNWLFSGWGETPKIYADTPVWKAGETYTVKADNPVVTLYAGWGVNFSGGSTPGAGGGDY